MKVTVTPHAGSRPDRGGDPLDGLVNLFDLGVVLSVAFLLAALSSLNLDQLLTKRDALRRAAQEEIRAKSGERVRPVGEPGGRVIGRGREVGKVYRLKDGRLVFVERSPVKFIEDGFGDAWDLLTHPDDRLLNVLEVTLQVAFWSTLFALLLGLPLGLALGLRRSRARRAGLVLVNAGMGLPPVVVGLIVALLLFREAPLGFLDMIYTVRGVILAQTVLSLPLVAALTAATVQAVPPALLDQARALGAGRRQVWWLALREARVGVFAAGIAALGSSLSEVGAVVLVGGNITGQTQTLASAVLVEVSAGDYGRAVALGLILLGLILVIVAVLTVAQQGQARVALRRAS